MKLSDHDVARFLARVDRSAGPSACHPWTGGLARHGYGRIKVSGKYIAAHRVAFELAHGPIPDGLSVCHHCDNRPCCNGAHLFAGTNADNTRDMFAKGRAPAQPRGEAHRLAKLTAADVVFIRHEIDVRRATIMEMARRFDVDRGTIRDVVNRRSWQHIAA